MRPTMKLLALALAVAGCAPMPVGPSVAVMPSPNKPFEVFQQEDAYCRNWAAQSVAGTTQSANDAAVASAATGAAIGALMGAAIGDHHTAGAGAAMGTAMGAAHGANQGAWIAGNAQRAYDVAYQQCMYSRGNHVPAWGGYRYYGPPPGTVMVPPPGVVPPPVVVPAR